MKIALFGANGEVGKRIAAEALNRDHDVLGVVRNPAVARLDDRAMITAADATFPRMVGEAISGFDVVVSAIGPRKAQPEMLVRAARGLLEGIAACSVGRLVVVGCAGISVAPPEVSDEGESRAQPQPPAPAAGGAKGAAEAKEASTRPHGPRPQEPKVSGPALSGSELVEAHSQVLRILEESPSELTWTWVVPTSPLARGERSGAYEAAAADSETLGGDPRGGNSMLTFEDLAVAIVDELEQVQFGRQAFSVAGA